MVELCTQKLLWSSGVTAHLAQRESAYFRMGLALQSPAAVAVCSVYAASPVTAAHSIFQWPRLSAQLSPGHASCSPNCSAVRDRRTHQRLQRSHCAMRQKPNIMHACSDTTSTANSSQLATFSPGCKRNWLIIPEALLMLLCMRIIPTR